MGCFHNVSFCSPLLDGGPAKVKRNYEANEQATKDFNAVPGSKGALSDLLIELIDKGLTMVARREGVSPADPQVFRRPVFPVLRLTDSALTLSLPAWSANFASNTVRGIMKATCDSARLTLSPFTRNFT
jgi:hypothetical protein